MGKEKINEGDLVHVEVEGHPLKKGTGNGMVVELKDGKALVTAYYSNHPVEIKPGQLFTVDRKNLILRDYE